MPNDSDIFEGDSSKEEKHDLALDLDLFNLSNIYKKYWKYPDRTDLFQAIFILISKGLPYEQYSSIMSKIAGSVGYKITSDGEFKIHDTTLKNWGLSSDKINGIRKILQIAKDGSINANTLCKVKEGGIYLVKAFKILQEEDDDIFLAEDYTVRRVLSILYSRSKILTIPEAKEIGLAWTGHRSQISYFLSRLKDSGAHKILNEKELEQTDFIGFENKHDNDNKSKSEQTVN